MDRSAINTMGGLAIKTTLATASASAGCQYYHQYQHQRQQPPPPPALLRFAAQARTPS